ncbi:hypothetical protein B4114_3065 [Geobacillus stearothermophilus]|uniref:Uncharacterized protein n=1 Tax=Geobacillus stearothermophilus TaxID=1422 RepID=A0A150ND43_GEOSE|nr:hypothetical protein B4114_3065 [Geobacillus stearothermophilus]
MCPRCNAGFKISFYRTYEGLKLYERGAKAIAEQLFLSYL